MMMPGRTISAGSSYRYGFNGKENDNELKGDGNQQDYGMRIYDPRVGKFLSVDPLAKNYPEVSNYSYAQNSPIYKVDIDGEWDITVHAYNDRRKYGYGVAIVKDRRGSEVFRFKVRLEGTGGRDRMKTDSDTPLGTYDIPDGSDKWTSGGPRLSYGPNPRLVLNGESGEITESERSLIRIHGGRQETPIRNKKGQIIGWEPISDPELKKTNGCLRASEEDMIKLKQMTDGLEKNDKQELGGKLVIVDDLKLDRNGNPDIPNAMKPKPASAPSAPTTQNVNQFNGKQNAGIIDKIKNWFNSWPVNMVKYDPNPPKQPN